MVQNDFRTAYPHIFQLSARLRGNSTHACGCSDAILGRAGLRFSASEEAENRPRSGEDACAISAGSSPVPAHRRRQGPVLRNQRTTVRDSLRMLNLYERGDCKGERRDLRADVGT